MKPWRYSWPVYASYIRTGIIDLDVFIAMEAEYGRHWCPKTGTFGYPKTAYV